MRNVFLIGFMGVGKSTVAKALSKRLGIIYVDTGALYRCVTLEALNNNVKLDSVDELEKIAQNIKVDLKVVDNSQVVLLNGEDVSIEIRTPRVTNNVSEVSFNSEVVLLNSEDSTTSGTVQVRDFQYRTENGQYKANNIDLKLLNSNNKNI